MNGYLFAGQGAQYVGMGADICSAFPAARGLYERASEVLGWDVARVCLDGPESELTKTSVCQPAILVTSIAVSEILKERGGSAAVAAGLSLGEYSALCYAGAIEFEAAVDLVRWRGQFMQECTEDVGGGMASVIGLDVGVLEEICASAGGAYIANINSPSQVVISGELEALDAAEAMATDRGAKMVVRLDVAGAFHSPLMADAADKLAEKLEDVEISAPTVPVFGNVTGRPVPDSAEGIRELLVGQVTSRVLWCDCVKNMISEGAKSFLEIGPGKVLTGLMRRIDRSVDCKAVCSVGEIDENI